LLNRGRFKIEERTKVLIALRWNWISIIPIMRLFQQENLTLSNNFFEKFKKLHSKMNSISYFFKKMLRLPKKLRLSITFSLLVQIEWIKASHVDKNIILEGKNFKKIILTFCDFFIVLPIELHFFLLCHNFYS